VSQVPNVGDKQRLVGPGSGGGGGPSPAVTAPPEVREASELGVSLLYALGDHTHQSPTIYWPQTGAPNSNVVSNRDGWITVTTATTGATNFCTYDTLSTSTGLAGDWGTIAGGYENAAAEAFAFIGGGLNNESFNTADVICGGGSNVINLTGELDEGYNAILGGLNNVMDGAYCCAILGGRDNVITAGKTPRFSSILSGQENLIDAIDCDARGAASYAYMDGQSAFASGGVIPSPGFFQYSKVVISNQLVTSDPTEWSNLIQHSGITNLDLLDDHAYTCVIEFVSAIVGTTDQRSWVIMASVRKDAGVITVVGYTTMAEIGTAATSTFVVEVTNLVGLLVVRFRTGTVSVLTVNLCATLRMTEAISVAPLGRHHVHHPSPRHDVQGAAGSLRLHEPLPGRCLHDAHRAVHPGGRARPTGCPPARHPQGGLPQERWDLPHRRGRKRSEPIPGGRASRADVLVGHASDSRDQRRGELQVRLVLARADLRDRCRSAGPPSTV
jgi:hypothetical protein